MTKDSKTMKAVVIAAPGGPEGLKMVTVPIPTLSPTQVLIKVAYAGLNGHDTKQRAKGPPPGGELPIPGLEVSGVIVEVGSDELRSRIGETVCALIQDGAYAEYCAAEAATTLPVPQGMSLRDAASIPEALFTSWHNLVGMGNLSADQWFLMHGGTSGIGVFAIQLANVLGARVIATAGSAEKVEFCRKLGAAHALNYQTEDFTWIALDVTAKRGVNVILDMMGGLYVERDLEALAMDGRILLLAAGKNPRLDVPVNLIMQKRAIITGSLLRPLPLARKAAYAEQLTKQIWPLLGTKIQTVIAGTHTLARAADAHRQMEEGKHIGKIVIEVNP